jgi:hypothetical protein
MSVRYQIISSEICQQQIADGADAKAVDPREFLGQVHSTIILHILRIFSL